MQEFRELAAFVTVEDMCLVRKLVFSGPMTPRTFGNLYKMATYGLGHDPVLVDTRSMVPLAPGDEFVVPHTLQRDSAVVVSPSNMDSAHAYSMAASKAGVTKMIFADYDAALSWVVRRRLLALRYPVGATARGCG